MSRERAQQLLYEFKGNDYIFGVDCLDRLGTLTVPLGTRIALIAGGMHSAWGESIRARALSALATAGATLAAPAIAGVRPNAPREDVFRLRDALVDCRPEVVVVLGAGSTIDPAKATAAMAVLGEAPGDIEAYFGVGQVSAMLRERGQRMLPLVAVQLAASSAAHLTNMPNVTDLANGQKKLIVDEAMVPARALFDYAVTTSMSRDFTLDGALDGFSHALEVFYGQQGDALARVWPVATLAMELIVGHIRQAVAYPDDLAVREILGLATDLGGYCIMLGGTNGAHLTSFSLVDLLRMGERAR